MSIQLSEQGSPALPHTAENSDEEPLPSVATALMYGAGSAPASTSENAPETLGVVDPR